MDSINLSSRYFSLLWLPSYLLSDITFQDYPLHSFLHPIGNLSCCIPVGIYLFSFFFLLFPPHFSYCNVYIFLILFLFVFLFFFLWFVYTTFNFFYYLLLFPVWWQHAVCKIPNAFSWVSKHMCSCHWMMHIIPGNSSFPRFPLIVISSSVSIYTLLKMFDAIPIWLRLYNISITKYEPVFTHIRYSQHCRLIKLRNKWLEFPLLLAV